MKNEFARKILPQAFTNWTMRRTYVENPRLKNKIVKKIWRKKSASLYSKTTYVCKNMRHKTTTRLIIMSPNGFLYIYIYIYNLTSNGTWRGIDMQIIRHTLTEPCRYRRQYDRHYPTKYLYDYVIPRSIASNNVANCFDIIDFSV